MPAVPRAVPARRSSGAAGHEAGVTLVEVTVAMALAGLVATALAAATLGVTDGTRRVQNTVMSTADARIGLEAIARMLRVAVSPYGTQPALVSTTDSSITFYASVDRSGAATTTPVPTLITYALSGGCITETRTPARAIVPVPTNPPLYAWDTGTTSRCLVRTTQSPTFTYFTSLATGATAVAAPTTPTARAQVLSVGIRLTARETADTQTAGSTAATRVGLQNVVAAAEE